MFYELNNNNDFIEYVRLSLEGTQKYVAFCDSLNKINQTDSTTVDEVFYKTFDLLKTCNQMSYQQAEVFRMAAVSACFFKLCGNRL